MLLPHASTAETTSPVQPSPLDTGATWAGVEPTRTRPPLDEGAVPDDVGDPVLARLLAVARTELGATTRLHLGSEAVEPPAAHEALAVTLNGAPDAPERATRLGTLVVPASAAGDGSQLLARLIADRLAGVQARDDLHRQQREQVARLLAPGGLTAAFQSIVSLEDARLVGVEALMRSGDGTAGNGPPQWLWASQRVGRREELERLAVTRALEGLDALPEDAFLALNVSAPVLASGAVTPLLLGAPLRRLVVELTEHEAVADYEALNRELAPLRQQGLRLAIDDVGAGFASMRHVVRTRPDIIKLDRAFLADLMGQPVSGALIASLSSFARAIGCTVIAEGVERRDEAATLRRLGVTWAQGHHFGWPRDLSALGRRRA